MSAELARIDYPKLQVGGGSSVQYDHSGGEELRKRQDAIAELASKKFQALYAGDIPAAVEAGSRIRELRNSMAGIEPVRVKAQSSESKYSLEGPSIQTRDRRDAVAPRKPVAAPPDGDISEKPKDSAR